MHVDIISMDLPILFLRATGRYFKHMMHFCYEDLFISSQTVKT